MAEKDETKKSTTGQEILSTTSLLHSKDRRLTSATGIVAQMTPRKESDIHQRTDRTEDEYSRLHISNDDPLTKRE